ncbi:MAG TPA: type II toxin-antitoxin system Phd/YefM family antitoxin [Dehalococcoidia bacterium]|nr:type II toxin-antitoxin system Phd/YefM family antitoxin [Dehalococcoidia bacterium]HLC30567.1 type II toxin-antitoxin system Phd/YefM family antitoxin [Dehalococcoidia bacterium]
MKIAPVAEIKARFSAYLKASEEGPVIVTKNGKPVAVLLAMGDEDELERLILAYSPKFQDLLRTAEKQVQEGLGIPHDKFWREMENESRDSLLATEGS